MTHAPGTLGIIGASGFIGGEVAKAASAIGWKVIGFSRRGREPDAMVSEWRTWTDQPDLSGLTAIVNLAGEPVDQRWTGKVRQRLRSSRIGVTETLTKAMASQSVRVLINGSAVGIYGSRADEVISEDASEGEGFLADLCRDWEAAADSAPVGTRVVKIRTGVVLGAEGQAWRKMRIVFSLGLGGRFGDGQQWMPWVHVSDLAGGIVHLLSSDVSGPVNGTAPEPERNACFTKKLASALSRPAFMHAPEWALHVGLGDFAGALLASQRVVPHQLLSSGYRFQFPNLEMAFSDLV